jgi:hypothetical protein
MRFLRTSLIVSHRYLGIALSLLVAMWFASGIVMMYAGGMPRLDPEVRLERLENLDLSKVKLTLAQAAEKLEIDASAGWDTSLPRGAGDLMLLTIMGRPAYRIGNEGIVFADTGEVLPSIGEKEAHGIAASFLNLPEGSVRFVGKLDTVDQWTIGQGRAMPQYKFAAADGMGTEVYVQPRTGEVSLMTTRNQRIWAWLGVIPHWLYFTPLRVNQPFWYEIMVWTSAIAGLVAVLGIVLAFTQWRRTRPFNLKKSIPYAGWMRWHYITGAVFGLTTATFAYSGMMSMEPFAWTNAEGLRIARNTFSGGPADLQSFGSFDPSAWRVALDGRAIKEIAFTRIQDESYYAVRLALDGPAYAKMRERLHEPYTTDVAVGQDRVLVSASTMQVRKEAFGTDAIIARLRAAANEAPIVEQTLLTEYDSYYYSRRELQPLPVLRVKFGDPMESWFYVDPKTSNLIAEIHKYDRLERWLYSALHNFDFKLLYDYRPAWDIVMLLLCLGGFVSSVIGVYLGLQRMRRAASRNLNAIRRGAENPAPAE